MFIKSVFITISLGASSLAFANKPAPAPLPGCATEITTYCKGVEIGQGRIAKCLRDNKERLGAACKANIQELVTKIKARREENPSSGHANRPEKK